MANKKSEDKAVVAEKRAKETAATVDNGVDIEKEEMKKQMAEMKAQMELMAQMIAVSKAESMGKPAPRKDRLIRFVNLINGTIVLKGNAFHDIEGRFNHIDINEREARLIVANMPNLVRSGKVYIADAQFVQENELEDVYATLLSDKQLEELLTKDASFVVDTYKNASDGQKDIIIKLVIDKRLDDKKVDANVLLELGRLSGKDLIGIEPEKDG